APGSPAAAVMGMERSISRAKRRRRTAQARSSSSVGALSSINTATFATAVSRTDGSVMAATTRKGHAAMFATACGVRSQGGPDLKYSTLAFAFLLGFALLMYAQPWC